MNREEVLKMFENVNVWKRGGERAPHKPLLILYALGKYSRGKDHFISYLDIDQDLRKLLVEFGPPRKSFHPEYPFWYMQNDKFWILSDNKDLKRRKGGNQPTRIELINHKLLGGFSKPIYDLLQKDKDLIKEISMNILENNFPDSMHEDIISAVGLDIKPQFKRDPEFRNRIIRAYEYRCAVCGYNVILKSSILCLEAAHIKWREARGPNDENNGLALCTLHHKLFDRGAFTISKDYVILVSQDVHGGKGLKESLLNFHGQSITTAQNREYFPKSEYLEWHYKEVFKGPERLLT